jgi:hypothetical protein
MTLENTAPLKITSSLCLPFSRRPDRVVVQ